MDGDICVSRFGRSNKFWKTCITIFIVLMHSKIINAGTLERRSKLMWPVSSDVSLDWTFDNAAGGQSLLAVEFGLMDSNTRVRLFDVRPQGLGSPIPQDPWPSSWTWYQNRLSWTGDLSIKRITFKLTNATLNDTREFFCKAEWKTPSDAKVSFINLFITEPPGIMTPVFQNPYVEGNTVAVMCNATGTPTPTVKWVKEPSGEVLSSGEGSATLSFSSVNRADAGNYRCKANNSAADEETDPLPMVIHYPVSITNHPQNKTVTEKEGINLKCEADGLPVPSILWSRADGSPLQGDTNKTTYSIAQSKRGDAGQYKCTATNTVGEESKEATAIAFVNVQYKPSINTSLPTVILNETDPLKLQCTADGNPEPEVSWRKSPSSTVIKKGTVYDKAQVTKDDSGKYTCTATNILDDAVANVVVTVQYKPVIDKVSSSRNVGSWDNNEITLSCLASGLPPPDFQWFKPRSRPITQGTTTKPNGSKLTVKTSGAGDYGEYKCRVTNKVGSSDLTITVNQWRKPKQPKNLSFKEKEASYVTLTWAEPSDNGGSPVIDYKIKIQNNKDTAETKEFVNVTGTEKFVDKLTPGATYSVWVNARNIVGYGVVAFTPFTTKEQGKPGVPILQDISKTIVTNEIELTWSAASENGGEILTYTIWWREVKSNGAVGRWSTKNTSSTELTYTLTGLEYGKTYDISVTAWNKFGQNALDEENNLKQVEILEPTVASTTPKKSTGVSAAVIGGGVAAAVVIILVVIIVIVLLKRRKGSPGKAGESRDPLGSSGDEGYSSVSKASAARRLGRNNAASEDAGIPTYATVDMSKKKPKKPDLIYAELADFNENPAAQAASIKRQNQPGSYVPSDYAEIAQFGRPSEEPTYDNVPRY